MRSIPSAAFGNARWGWQRMARGSARCTNGWIRLWRASQRRFETPRWPNFSLSRRPADRCATSLHEHVSPIAAARGLELDQEEMMRRLWIAFTLVMGVSFLVLGWI